jgi:hypothetical protein
MPLRMKTRTPGGASDAPDALGEPDALDALESLGVALLGAALLEGAVPSSFWVGAEGGTDGDGDTADGAAADGTDAGGADAPCAALLAFTDFVGVAAFTTGFAAPASARAQLELATSPTQTSPRMTADMLAREYSEARALTTPL